MASLVRRVAAATGVITSVAGGYALFPSGPTTFMKMYQSDFSGDGGPGTSARLRRPTALVVDGGGNVFIADTENNRIRRLAAGTGVITTVAGNGFSFFGGDGGPATSAGLGRVTGLAVAGSNVLFSDSGSHRIRQLAGAAEAASSTATGTPSPSATATGTPSPSAAGTPASSASSAATPSSSRAAQSPSRAARSPSNTAARSNTRSRSPTLRGDTSPSVTVTTTPRPSRSNGHKGGCGYGGPCYTNSPTKSFNQNAVSRSRTKKAKRAV